MRANKPITPPGYSLHPFQKDGVSFLTDEPFVENFHKLLADDMGLGKTIQVAAALNRIDADSVVIICPASVKIHWARKLAEWLLKKHYIYIVKDGKAQIPPGASIIIVNYDLLVDKKKRDGGYIRSKVFKQLVARGEQQRFCAAVIDEAHYLKSMDASRTTKVLGVGSFLHHARYKWALTGTPVLNRPAEIYPLLYTFAPHTIAPYTSWQAFGEYFCNGHQDRKCRKCGAFLSYDDSRCPTCGSNSIDRYGFNTKGHSHVAELAERMEGFMLRRKKEDVLDQLPDKVETVIELDIVPPSTLDDTHIATVRRDLALAKIPMATKHIADMLADIDKVVVFAHHRDVIEGLRDALQNFGAVICYGGMSADQKQKSIDEFINNPSTQVYIAQTVAGGVGVDGLQKVCSHVVFIELDWAPGYMDQAVDRIMRMGQKSETVFVQYLAVPDSLDTMMDGVLQYKRSVINQLIKAKEVNYTMTIEQSLERIAAALEALASGGQLAPAAAPAAPKKGNSTKKADTPADPAVTTPAPAPAKAEVTEEMLRAAATKFMADRGDGRTPESNKDIINNVIWPKLGVTAMAELKPEQYADAIAELNKGPAAFATATTADTDDLLGV